MKKIILSLLLLGLYGKAMGQDEGNGKILKPDVTAPSPQAYALTKYGDIPVNEFSGMVNATIPIYTAKVGKLELPIALNYAAAGVKVNQTATWTGINWTLNAGGVISRTINDAPDESISADKRLTADMIIPNQLVNGSAHAYFLNGVFVGARKHYDFKPDLWNFSFGNYSGTFYLDADFMPKLSKVDSPLKVEIVGSESDMRQRFRNSQEFCITTPDGVKYYFGGQNACESSFMGSHRDNPYANTGFYLYKIQHPDYGVILFEYDTDTVTHSVWTSQEESITVKVLETREDELCKRPPTNEGQHSYIGSATVTLNGKWLKRIYSPHSYLQILFNRSNGSGGNYKYVLDNVEVKEGSTMVRKAEFTYLFPQTKTTSERFFLTKVEFDKDRNYGSGHGRKNEEYILDYNDPLGLPNRRSEAKDLLGYYNGKSGNTTALPQNEDLLFHNYYPNLADRSPSAEHMAKGSLVKITYPTKGYTIFEYETPKAKAYDRQGRSMLIWRNSPGRVPASRTNIAIPLGDFIANPDGTFGTSAAVIDEEIRVRVDLMADAQMGHTDRITFRLVDQTTGTVQSFLVQMPDGNQEIGTGDFNFSREFTINVIKDHIYTVEMYNNYSAPVMFEANAYFFHTRGFKTVDEQGGLRVKRTTDFTENDQTAFSKRFYYTQAKDVYVDPFSLMGFKKNVDYVTELYLTKCCSPGGVLGPGWMSRTGEIKLRTLYSSSVFTSVFDQKYEYVTVSYGGDNFELGGKQKQFVNKSSSTYQEIHPFYVSPFQNEHAMYKGNLQYIYEGTLLSEMEIMKRGNTLYKVSEQKYEYDYIPYGNGITGVIGGYAHMNCGYPTDGADNLDIAKFEFMSKKVNLVSKSTKEFVVPMPLTMDATFEANYKPVTSVTEYIYDGLPGLPTKVRTSVSENNNFTEVRNTYADQAATLSGLTADQLTAYTKLVEKNKVNQPIEVKTYRADNSLPVLVTTNRTLFKNWGTTLDLILPEMIQQSKSSRPLEDRVQFKAYDNRGNLTLLAMVNGARTRYEYDPYDNLKAKIENYNGSDAAPDQAPNIPVDFESGTPAPCTLGSIYPGAMVTWYYYDTFSRLLRRTVDGNCRSTYYEYDALLRLKRIKDHDGNIIEEYDTNYKLN
ncbi:hypothetical protein [Flavobacterium sp. CAU 1735]|uniref:hypothetical protein n=1 Tax=Flavobacterium sp. CAU 1735 TaxID=3140361 RepID=UPI003260AE2D